VDEDDFDLAGFDEAYSPDDFSQADMDFATAVGMQTAGAGSDDDSAAQFIANQFAQPQAGMNRSNIRGTANFDPQFAAAFDISRGLDPTNNFGGTGGLAVPSYLRPQTPGNLVLNEAGDRMMYGSPVERFAQETAPEFIRGIQKVGIGGLLNTISEAFSDAKRAIGLDGGAQGGLKAEDLQPTMGTLDPSDRFLGDMSQQGAGMSVTDPVVPAPASVNMASVPQVSPMFDQFGNPYRSGFDRNMAEMAQQSLSGGIASVAPNQAQEVGDAMRDTFVTTTPNISVPGFKSSPMSKKEAEDIKKSLGIMNISNRTDPRNVFLNERATQQFSGPVLRLPDQVVNQMPFRNVFDVGTMKGFDLLDNFKKLDREEALYGRAIRENELEI